MRLATTERWREELIERERGTLTVVQVFERLTDIALTEGEGSVAKKVSLLADLIRQVGKQEVRYLLRIPLGRLRLGVGDPTVMDALSFARTASKDHRPALDRAYGICADLATVAKVYLARRGRRITAADPCLGWHAGYSRRIGTK